MSEGPASLRPYLLAGVGGLVVAIGLTAAFTLSTRPKASPPASAREVAPDFELPRLQGGTVKLSALRGKVVVVDFWATWCPPCRAEMPWLVQLAKRLEPRGVTLVAISEDDPPGQVPLVTEFSRGVPGLGRYAVLGDPEVEARYGVTSLPTLFLVDRQGRIAATLVGSAEAEKVATLVERLAAE